MDYSRNTDEELVALAKTDEEACNVLIGRYLNVVKSVSRSYFLTSGDIDDLIQVGMIGVFKAISTYNGASSFRTYAYKCIKTSIFSAIKQANCKKNLPLNNYISLSGSIDENDDLDKSDIVMDINNNPEKAVMDKEAENELKAIINDVLTELEHKILILYLQGYSYFDIAEKSGKNIKSIDNALQRIRKKILASKNKKS